MVGTGGEGGLGAVAAGVGVVLVVGGGVGLA